MTTKRLAGYLINTETGVTMGVNSFSLLIVKFYQSGENATTIAKIYKKQRNDSRSLERLTTIISDFIEQLRIKKFVPNKMRVIHLDNPLVPPLLMVQLDLSWACNLHCRHCYLGNGKLIDKPLSREEWKEVINQAYGLQVPKIAFLGGEPLIAPNFFELVEYASNLGFKLYTTTNCTLVTPKTAIRLKEVGFNEIDVSIDGANPVSHEFLRGEGLFRKTIQGIKYLVDEGLRVKSATVIYKKNVHEIQDLIRLGYDIGLHHMYFNALLPGGEGKEIWKEYQISAEEWLKVKEIIAAWNSTYRRPKVFAENGFVFNGSLRKDTLSNLKGWEYAGCKAGKRELIIAPDGFAIACPILSSERKFHTMSIRQYSLKQIWEQDEWVIKLRQVNETTLQGKCRTCSYRIICKGGCHILTLFEYGHINYPDPRCHLTS